MPPPFGVLPPLIDPLRRRLLQSAAGVGLMSCAAEAVHGVTGPASPPKVPLALSDRINRDFVLPLLDILAKGAGVDWAIQFVPFGRLLMMAEHGQALGFGVGRTPAREASLSFSQPVFNSRLWAVTRRDRRLSIQQLADLQGRTVCTSRNVSYGAAFDEARVRGEFKVSVSDGDVHSRLQMMLADRCDVVVAIHRSADPQLLERRLRAASGLSAIIEVGARPLSSDPVNLAVQRGSALASHLPAINRALVSQRAALEALINSDA